MSSDDDDEPKAPTPEPLTPVPPVESPRPPSQPPPLVHRSLVEASSASSVEPAQRRSIYTPGDYFNLPPPVPPSRPPPEESKSPPSRPASIWTPHVSVIPPGGTPVSPIRISGRKRKASPRFSAPFPTKKNKKLGRPAGRNSLPVAGTSGEGARKRGRPRKSTAGSDAWVNGKFVGYRKKAVPPPEPGSPSQAGGREPSVNESLDGSTLSSVSDDASVTSSSVETNHFYANAENLMYEELPFQIGDLVWASVNSFSYWPAIICQEYKSASHYMLTSVGMYQKPKYHIMYLCDKNRCNWVPAGRIIPFQGSKEFEAFKQKKLDAAKGKFKKAVARYFTVHPRYMDAYNEAVKLGDAMMGKTRQERCVELLVLNKEDEAIMTLPSPVKEPTQEEADQPSRPTSGSRAGSRNQSTARRESDAEPAAKRALQSKPSGSRGSRAKEPEASQPQAPPEPQPSTSSAATVEKTTPVIFAGSIIPKFDRRKEKLCALCEDWIPEGKTGTPVIPPAASASTSGAASSSEEPQEAMIDGVPLGLTKIECAGTCGRAYHRNCLAEFMQEKPAIKRRKSKKPEFTEECLKALEPHTCKECTTGKPSCFICNKVEIQTDEPAGAVMLKCWSKGCKKMYHTACVKRPEWNQRVLKNNKLTCPLHKCHTCTIHDLDNPRASETYRLLQCIKCPTAYHYGVDCSPAGTTYLGGNLMVCPKLHGREKPTALNVNFCFGCGGMGDLICCDACPGSFHPGCLTQPVDPDKDYLCDACEGGTLPKHEDVVWAKMGHYRWWPGVIVDPEEVPLNVRALQHERGQFPVKFYGTGEYFWADRTRVYYFQEEDTKLYVKSDNQRPKFKPTNKMDHKFLDGLKEAAEAYVARAAKLKELKKQPPAKYRTKPKPPHYQRIKVNKPYGRVKPVEFNESEIQSCECDPNGEDPCGADSGCLNRSLMMECHPSVCRAGDKCGNQRLQKRQYPQVEPFLTGEKGWGLRALENVKKGDFVIEYVGELIDDEECERRLAEKHQTHDRHFYFLSLENNRTIDAGPKGNLARFMNHSCDPNCMTQKWVCGGENRVGLFATRDIISGEELTFNYQLESFSKTKEKRPCVCGASCCAGFIGAKAKETVVENGEMARRKVLLAKRKAKPVFKEDTCRFCAEKVAEDACVFCSDCPRSYHPECLQKRNFIFTKEDGKKWRCPWHFCDEPECKAEADMNRYSCDHCPGSFCREHGEQGERIVWLGKLGFVCKKHSKRAVEALVNLITPEIAFGIGQQRRSVKKVAVAIAK